MNPVIVFGVYQHFTVFITVIAFSGDPLSSVSGTCLGVFAVCLTFPGVCLEVSGTCLGVFTVCLEVFGIRLAFPAICLKF